ncbi:beta-L-arabinofuranosidase domain-containing protein [Sphingomonas oryzagri]|uniref:Glycoside hydrolase family 127 protein n=1 Tax=Sphingomonas oryzagri TaxID=3042314 RepID=A0ABT6N1I6_9SPHN|nr:beta-L-arabinofuranosidase domain-containing protein [Sphingomonas oryzagri]MDH7639097.1 glycoside hydrolase family 127 protein [Sphingomonas oryzagri]
MNDCKFFGAGFTRRALLRSCSYLSVATWLAPGLARADPALPAATVPHPAPPRAPGQNRAPLAGQPFLPLPSGSIRPAGWLERQMRIQADGMGGRLDETWPDVGPNSGWLGGTGESWERGPYFVDGLLPLAWALDDPALKAKAQRFIDWTLDHPQPDGMFGPTSNDDWWPRMVMLKVLIQYHELTDDPRVIPLMRRYFAHQLKALPARPLKDWGRFRWQDELVAVLWLYNRTGDASLLQLAELLRAQGWNWQAEYADFPFKAKLSAEELGLDESKGGNSANGLSDRTLSAHGVNNAMGVKTSPLWSIVSGRATDRDAIKAELAVLDRYHGLPIGIFSADEHLAGTSPSQGIETCAIVEMMYSLELALAITGDAAIADRIERIAYNALPAAFTDDMWAHQYDQQPNQIKCSLAKGPWTTNGPEANLFGLEPHFGCCTANFHQGWPKLNASLWMATAGGGLAAMLYAPCTVSTVVGDVPLRIEQATDYPFRDTVSIALHPEREVAFPLVLRVPGWARSAKISINGAPAHAASSRGFVTIRRSWRAGDRVEASFDVATRRVETADGASTVEHGALLYVLPIEENWEKWRPRGLTADWQVYPASPWNVGLAPDASLHRTERAVSPTPFSRRSPAAVVTTSGQAVPEWIEAHGGYAEPPPRGLTGNGDQRPLTLIPYGAAKLRITAFPTLTV